MTLAHKLARHRAIRQPDTPQAAAVSPEKIQSFTNPSPEEPPKNPAPPTDELPSSSPQRNTEWEVLSAPSPARFPPVTTALPPEPTRISWAAPAQWASRNRSQEMGGGDGL